MENRDAVDDTADKVATCSGASGDLAGGVSLTRRPLSLLLRGFRDSLCMSQRELARRSGSSQGSIAEIEAGREALFSTYERLAGAMGASIVCALAAARSRDEIVAELVEARLEAERRRLGRRRSRRRKTS